MPIIQNKIFNSAFINNVNMYYKIHERFSSAEHS